MKKRTVASKRTFAVKVGQKAHLFVEQQSDLMVGWDSVDDEVIAAVEASNTRRRDAAKAELLAELAKL